MGRRRKRRLHARSAGSQPPPPETRAASSAGGEPRSDGAGSSSTVVGRCNKRPGVADSVPDTDKRRKLENDDNAVKDDDDGETTEEDEQSKTTTATVGVDRNGSGGAEVDPVKSDLDETDRNGSDPVEDDPVKTDEDGSNRVGSVENGDGGEGVPGDPWSLLSQGDPETSIVVTCGKNEGRLYLYKLRVVVSERCRSKCIRTGNTWWTPNEFQFVSGRGAAKDWKRTVKHAGRCLKALLASGTLCLSSTPPRCLCDSCTAQGCGKTADESDDIGRNINAGGDDLSNGKPVQDASNIRNKGIKRRRPIKRHIKGADAAVPLLGDGSAEPVSVPSKKRRKLVRNAKPEAHSDSTVSLSADVIFESGSGAAEVGGAKSSDVSRTVEAPVPVLPPPPLLVGERKRGRPKKKTRAGVAPSKKPSDGGGKTETKVKSKVKVAAEKDDSISGQSVPLIDGCCPVDEVAPPHSSELLPQESPDGERRTGPAEEDGSALPGNRSTRLNDVATTIPPPTTTSASRSSSPEASEAAAATDQTTSKNDALHLSLPPLPLSRDPSSHSNSISSIVVNQSPETDAPPFAGKVEPENVVDVAVVVETSTTDHGASDPLPVCPSGDAHAPDGAEVDPRRTEDDVTVGGDVKDDVKTGSSPVLSDDVVTEMPLAEPRRKNAYLNAVIAELKRKKISRETSVTNNSSTGTKDHHHHHQQQQQQQQHQHQHQRTRHPSDQQPMTVSLIKTELSPESKSISDALIRDIRSPLSGLTSPSSSSFCSSYPPLAFVPTSNSVAGKPLSCLKTLPVDMDRKDVAPYPDVRSGSGTRRTDWRTTSGSRGTPLPTPDFPYGEAAFWRHLPSMVGAPEGKAGGGGGGGGKQQPGVGGRAADMSSPLSMSQLASICGLSQSQLASLPFPPPQFSLYPPYLFMGFPLQPLLPEFQSGSHPTSPAATAAGGAASTTATTGGHPSIQRPPSHPLPPPASSSTSASAPSNAPSSQQHHQQQQQQQPRRRRSHHHHHCKSSSSSSASGPPKDPLFRHPPTDPHHAASYSALRKTDSTPTNQSAALLSELSRWRSCAPGLSSQPWTGTTTKSNSPNRFGPTGSDVVQERKLWRPAAAIASSAKEYSPAAYESSIVPSRSSAHAPAKECAVTCRSYGDTSLAAHAHRFDSLAPVDFTRRFRARDETEERKYSAAITGSGEYPCDEQGVLDLSKK